MLVAHSLEELRRTVLSRQEASQGSLPSATNQVATRAGYLNRRRARRGLDVWLVILDSLN